MAQRISKRTIMISAVAIALVVLVVFLLGNGADTPDTSSEEPAASAGDRDPVATEETTSGAIGESTVAPMVATTETGELIPPPSSRTQTTQTTPADPSNPNPTPAPSTPEEQAYLEETKRVVETNANDLAAMTGAVIDAVSGDDRSSLSTMLASDESGGAEFVETMVTTYPHMQATQLGSSINVFSTSEITLYIAYMIVTWTDGGITSQHTIPVTFRFIDGEWRLSTLGDASPDLQFVQAVPL